MSGESVLKYCHYSNFAKTHEFLKPFHYRTTTLVTTLASTEPVIKVAFDQWTASYPALKNVAGLIFSLVLEPLPPAIYKPHAEANALGFADRTESLVIVELFASWTSAADDTLVNSTLQALLEAIDSQARGLGGHDPYLFANYAGKDQEVIASYGTASVERMRRVSQAVDPKGIWRKLVPGGYKIPSK